VNAGVLRGIDRALLDLVQAPHLAALDVVASLVTIAGQAEVAAGLAAGLIVARLWRRRRDWPVPLAIAIVVAVEVALKLAVDQPVPPRELARGFDLPFVRLDLGASYPSGHVSRDAFLLAIARLPAWVAGVGIALVALTRVYLAQHWPSDVVGGALLGLGVALLAASIPAWSARN
jgi:membrane-associated phospholipid phosphatase